MTERVVSHHVDALELTCSAPQVGLLMKRPTDRLEERLAAALRDARSAPAGPVATGWTWDVSADPEPVLLLPHSLRQRRPYTLTCSAWMLFVAPARSVIPRFTEQLDALWQHLARTWLVLRTVDGDMRVERRDPEGWWRRLSELADLDSSVGRRLHPVERVARETVDVGPLLRQATGTLAAIGAAHENARLDELLAALRTFVLERDGESGFAERVARARLRRTVAGRASPAVVRAEAERLLGKVA